MSLAGSYKVAERTDVALKADERRFNKANPVLKKSMIMLKRMNER